MGAPWIDVGAASDVSREPLRVEVQGTALVVWRGALGRIAVFVDRCPHRDLPLSDGRRTLTGRLVCDHHGWEFAPDGRCLKAPVGTPHPAHVVECRVVSGRVEVRLAPDAPAPEQRSDQGGPHLD